MGDIRRLPMRRWIDEYGLNTFVETGVDGGAAMIAALKRGYSRAISIEIMPGQVERASRNIAGAWPGEAHRWEIRLGDSAQQIPILLREPRFADSPTVRVLWWLDAHYPERYQVGADLAPHGAIEQGDFGTRLPLLREVTALAAGPRDLSRDVIVIDDWRVYAEIENESGPLPAFLRNEDGTLPERTHGEKILQALSMTHNVNLDLRDGGYLICLPR